jgi:hypothetical protein
MMSTTSDPDLWFAEWIPCALFACQLLVSVMLATSCLPLKAPSRLMRAGRREGINTSTL